AKAKKIKAEDRRALRSKLAELLANELGKVEDAVVAYKELIEEDDDEAPMAALDALLRRTDRRDDLRWLFELRVQRANTSHKLELLSEWALLEEETFAAPEKAVSLYRRILEVVPKHGKALRALSRLLRASGDAAGAVDVLEKERDEREGADRARSEVELARLYLHSLRRPIDALSAGKRALHLVPNDPDAIVVIEELLQVAEARGRAAAALEESYAATNKLDKQAEVLEVLIATAAAKADRIALYVRLAEVYAKLNHA